MHWNKITKIITLLGLTMWLAAGCAEAPIDEPSSSEPAAEALSIDEQEQELGGYCRADFQCPVPRITCRECADGSRSCPTPRCSGGKCSWFFPACPAPIPNPCAVTLCKVGTQCVEVGNPPRAECVPIDRCATVRCAAGFHCDDGQCLPDEKVFCGGIAGIPCKGAGTCIDDPSDNCDPKNGGADCGGLCTCPAFGLCRIGSHWDPSPSVCACVPNTPTGAFCGGIAGIPCEDGSKCVDDPSDDCDPKNGGADCGGICVPSTIGQQCGDNVCGEGTFCCNSSCGICAPKGGACIQIACLPKI